MKSVDSRLLSRTNLPVIRIFGVDGDQNDDESDFLKDKIAPGCYIEDAEDILKTIPGIMEHVNPLMMVGINNHVDLTAIRKKLLIHLNRSVSDGAVSFWNIVEPAAGSEDDKYFQDLLRVIQQKRFNRYEDKLQDVIRANKSAIDDMAREEDGIVAGINNDVYYRAQKAVGISPEEYLLFRNVGTLLTEREVNQIRPYGTVQHREWFANFLNLSSVTGPQWYGYPQSLFYVKRSYEDALVGVVRDMLAGKQLGDRKAPSLPVILTGDPGSSKTITLGALAYRVYNEKINPVIYISNASFLKENYSAKVEALDECIKALEGDEADSRRVLVIWDSSTYRQVLGDAKNLLQALLNRGRRVVLVCSGYNLLPSYDNGGLGRTEYYQSNPDNSNFVECQKADAQIAINQECCYVLATRVMNDKEKALFWDRVRNYSGINLKTIASFRRQLNETGKSDIFDHYYWLITVLRKNLENRLRDERSQVYNYVNLKLSSVLGEIQEDHRETIRNSPMFRAFLNAGFDSEQLETIIAETQQETGTHEDASVRTVEKCLDDFNACVALFSRFKLEVPYSLAYNILTDNNGDHKTSASNQELFRTVTTDLPWLYYGEGMDGDYVFRFRTSLEAEIYLKQNDISGEKQVALLCWIIQLYGVEYHSSKCLDIGFTENLQSLLRLIGPNSSYSFFQSSQGDREHAKITKHLNRIISAIRDLIDKYGVPDDDAGFATLIITFTREFYGNIGWNRIHCKGLEEGGQPWEVADDPNDYSIGKYEERIQIINEAIVSAEKNIERLDLKISTASLSRIERNHLIRQKNSLTVEMAQCAIRLDELTKSYRDRCEYGKKAPDRRYMRSTVQYRTIYNRLIPVIRSDSLNGYAYNSLFNAFERMYESEGNNERRILYLSEIMTEVENCEMLSSRIVNRGSNDRDELSEHLNKIRDYCAQFKVSIDSIYRFQEGIEPENEHERIFCSIFEEKLKIGDPSAITFLCQKEISYSSNTTTLNQAATERFTKAYQFMVKPSNYECVIKSSYAVAMLIRIAWAMYNGTKLSNFPECQLTHISPSQWANLRQYCAVYNDVAQLNNKQPLILLIYALSELQSSGPSQDGYFAAKEIIDHIHEDLFYQRRMWTPFMVCRANGEPIKYTGTVISVKKNDGFIRVNGVPFKSGRESGVRFRRSNLGWKEPLPEVNDVLTDLEIGISYTGFSVYKEAGRRTRSEGDLS